MPRTRSRWLIGYVTRDPEVMRLALILADALDVEYGHPMVLAVRWLQAGYSVDTAAWSCVTVGVTSPEAVPTGLRLQLDFPNPSGTEGDIGEGARRDV
jgi:hypothetical protein